jgi:hypothetical protein
MVSAIPYHLLFLLVGIPLSLSHRLALLPDAVTVGYVAAEQPL